MSHAEVAQVSAQQPRLEWIQDPRVGSAHRFAASVERQHERIGEGDPAESRRCEPSSHRNAVGEHHVDVQLIEDPDWKLVAPLPPQLRARLVKCVRFRRATVTVTDAVERSLRVAICGTTRTQSKRHLERREGVQWKRVIVGIGLRTGVHGQHRMRMRVDRPERVDVGQQILIGTASGDRTRGGGGDGKEQADRAHADLGSERGSFMVRHSRPDALPGEKPGRRAG